MTLTTLATNNKLKYSHKTRIKNCTVFLVKLIVFQVTKSELMRQLAVSILAQTVANTSGVLSAVMFVY